MEEFLIEKAKGELGTLTLFSFSVNLKLVLKNVSEEVGLVSSAGKSACH